MISIIICSRFATISSDLRENIESTIGFNYELIAVDNSDRSYSIFEAYNVGIQRSKGKVLCFIHDDIYFHTSNWGFLLYEIFDHDLKVALVGIAGARVKSKTPSSWWQCSEDNYVINIRQHTSDSKIVDQVTGFKNDSTLEEVVVIDGVFMAMRRIEDFQFESTMTGFHNYDLNLSFAIKKRGLKIVVTKDLLIEHYSQGNVDRNWFESAIKIHRLYRKHLPLKSRDGDHAVNELSNGYHFIRSAISQGDSYSALKVWFFMFKTNPLSGYHFSFLKRILVPKNL